MVVFVHDFVWQVITLFSYLWWLITAINNILTPTVEITSHTERHTQCYSIESKDVKKDTPNYVKVSQKKAKCMKK